MPRNWMQIESIKDLFKDDQNDSKKKKNVDTISNTQKTDNYRLLHQTSFSSKNQCNQNTNISYQEKANIICCLENILSFNQDGSNQDDSRSIFDGSSRNSLMSTTESFTSSCFEDTEDEIDFEENSKEILWIKDPDEISKRICGWVNACETLPFYSFLATGSGDTFQNSSNYSLSIDPYNNFESNL